ncbi:uncharacterized protein VTP21DRAFT_5638 [Calcarisporiella thermophila]|uniref:uncharacterized protein n=1 Tax=Calcarisporiella thermophila TaxID=911321 RepID=UPI0037420E06
MLSSILSLYLIFIHLTTAIQAGRLPVRGFGPRLSHSTFATAMGPAAFSSSLRANPLEIALHFAREQLTNSEFVVKNSYRSNHNGVTHVYLRQRIDGLEVANGDININVDGSGRVVSYGNSFYPGNRFVEDLEQPSKGWFHSVTKIYQYVIGIKHSSSRSRLISAEEALISLYDHLGLKLDLSTIQTHTIPSLKGDPAILLSAPQALSPIPARRCFIQTQHGLERAWEVIPELDSNWIQGYVSARTGDVLSLVDWVADASYNVYPLGENDPLEGPRQLLHDPNDVIASPLGWHTQYLRNYSTTVGNNVYAHENHEGSSRWLNNYRPEGGAALRFDFPLDLKKDPKTYLDAAVTNLFYWNNMMHDLSYRYGFNEEAGNFQENNYGLGGEEGDAVIANAQDGSGFDNANFATPPDGMRGKMRMYLWDETDPLRDGDLEAGIIVHEYTHGISNRLTGGPANSGCLGWGESGGMGEGWGDFIATILRMRPEFNSTVEFGMGEYANGGQGIRKYKYSTSKKTNPETYGTMNKPGYWGVHAKGAVWANMLYEVYWNLVDKHHFNPEWFPPPTTNATAVREHILGSGNTLMLQLVLDGMKLQPCRPEFTDARDAILQADKLLTGGENQCEIWKGFAKRGLGMGARVVGGDPWGGGERVESFRIPRGVC